MVQQRGRLRHSMTKVKNPFTVTLATQMAAILSPPVDCPVWAISPDADPRITGSTGGGDCRRLAGCHVTFNGTGVSGVNAGSGSGTQTTDRGAGEAANEFAATNALPPVHKETAAIFDLYSHLLSGHRLRHELFAEVDEARWQKWAVKRSLKNLPNSLPR